ncbi:MAG: hypothetical protein IKK79_04575 [Spirochaetaceae bacterium]|nr:hypothetical protein [Spirochaetaceae bacterium]
MNRYVFYTFEGFTESPTNAECDNIQILGFEEGINLNEAKNTLITENAWIQKYGFNIHEIYAKQLLTDENKVDIKSLIDYLRDGGKKYCKEDKANNSNPILVIVEKLQQLIDG